MSKMISIKMQKKVGLLFDLYSKNLGLYIGQHKRYFLCPLCHRAFPDEAIAWGHISLAHIVPESLGGKECSLLCQACNSRLGFTIESKAHIGHSFYAPIIEGGYPRIPAPMTLAYQGQEFQFLASHSIEELDIGKVFTSSINADRLEPQSARALIGVIKDLQENNERFDVKLEEPRHYDGNIARKLDVAIGFLAMFNLMGYEFALSSVGLGMRDVLADPAGAAEFVSFMPKGDVNLKPGKVMLLQSNPPSFLVAMPICKPFLDNRLLWIPPLIGDQADWTHLESKKLAACKAVDLRRLDLTELSSQSIYHTQLYGKILLFDGPHIP